MAMKSASASNRSARGSISKRVTAASAAMASPPPKSEPMRSGATGKTAAKKKATSAGPVQRRPVAAIAGKKTTANASRKPRATATTVRRAASRDATAAPAAQGARASGTSPAGGHWVDTLRDGTQVLIRAITKQDEALERAFIKRLSPQSKRLRFLGQIGEPSDKLVRSLTDLDWQRDAAFIALVHRDSEKREIGVSRFSLSADGKTCECAITVDDAWHGRGLAVALMRHLIELARSRGITSMFSIDTADNQRMRDLAGFLGFERKADPDDVRQVIHTLTLAQ